jgi:hypothetical protein
MKYSQHDLDYYPIWVSEESAIYIFVHGSEIYKVMLFSIKDGTLHPAGFVYINADKLLRLIKKTHLHPTTKNIMLGDIK